MKLTKRSIEALEARATDYFEWDDELPRFGIRVQPSGRKTFVVQYRVNRRSRRMSLGRFGVVTPDMARGKALQALAMVEGGDDPLQKRQEKQEAITVKELAAGKLTEADVHPADPSNVCIRRIADVPVAPVEPQLRARVLVPLEKLWWPGRSCCPG